MYPKNAASPPRIAVGSIYQISDGAKQTTGASVTVTAEGGSETAGGGTLACLATSGEWTYVPTQAETNYSAFIVTVYKASCTSASVTIVTTAASTAGKASLDTDQAVNVTKFGGTSVTGRDIGASVIPDAATIRTAIGLASANLDTQLSSLSGYVDCLPASLNNLSAADIRTAVGLSSANLDTQLSTISGYVDCLPSAASGAPGGLPVIDDNLRVAAQVGGYDEAQSPAEALSEADVATGADIESIITHGDATWVSGETEGGTYISITTTGDNILSE